MNKDRLFSVLKIIVGGMVVLAGARNLITGIISKQTWAIACSIGLLMLVCLLVWVSIRSVRRNRIPIDERLTDPVYVELRTYLREALLPIGFTEVQEEDGLWFAATYSHGERSVRLGKDLREGEYYFGVSNHLNIVESDGKSVNLTQYDDVVENGSNLEKFKGQVRKKLTDWLTR